MLCQGVKQSGAPRARYLQHLKIQASEEASQITVCPTNQHSLSRHSGAALGPLILTAQDESTASS